MDKKNKIFLIITIILILALIIMSILYINMKKNAENNYNEMINALDKVWELETKVNELQEELNTINNTNTL